MELKPGQIIEMRNRLWRVDEFNDTELYATPINGDFDDKRVFLLDVENINTAELEKISPELIGDYQAQRMLQYAYRFDLMHGSAPFLSLQRSAVIPYNYQLVPLVLALEKPEARILIADDVGLGKTIEAGLIISELIQRGKIKRILILTPANLKEQWQESLDYFFHNATIEKDIDNLILELGYTEDQIKVKHYNGYIYLDTSDIQLAENYFSALKNLLDCFDFQFETEGKFIIGSLKRSFGIFFKKVGHHFDPDEVFEKLKHALELKHIDKEQAIINKYNMEAASVFLKSVENIPNAASYSGSLLILKTTSNGVANVITRTLTTKEVLELDKNPALCDCPLALIDNLKALTS